MKRVLMLCCLFMAILHSHSVAQTATSVANGNWMMTTTWDCNCVPTPGYTVVINHDVTLSSDWAISSGSITIGSTGILDDDGGGYGVLINSGGTLNVIGSFTMTKLAVTGGTITNTGIITGLDSLYLDAVFENQGVVESSNIFNAGSWTNEEIVNAMNFYNNGGLLNYSGISSNNFTNADTCENYGEFFIDDFTNLGYVNNKYRFNGTSDFLNKGEFYNVTDTAVLFTNNILNVDSVNHDAVLLNWGSIFAGNNFLNYDLVTGNANGFYCTYNYTANYGSMVGNFTFDDNTPPATEPYIDYNSGTLDSLIVWISDWCFESVPEAAEESITLYPNPADDVVNAGIAVNSGNWELFDMTGRKVLSGKTEKGMMCLILVSSLPEGLYVFRWNDVSGSRVAKLEVK